MHAIDAIARSISYNEIVTLDDEPGLRDALLVECDAHVVVGGDEDSDGIIEYWGIDDTGAEWRVHVRS